MDPNTLLEHIAAAQADLDSALRSRSPLDAAFALEQMSEASADLAAWLHKGGFLPYR